MRESEDDFNRRRYREDKFPPRERNTFDFQDTNYNRNRVRRDSDRRSSSGMSSYGNRSSYGGGGGGYDNKRSYRDSGGVVQSGNKRSRRDWEDTYDPQPTSEKKTEEDAPKAQTRAAILLSFKQFLATQDDSITDDEAIKKYHDYKTEFKRTELHNFFVAHKDEEWFRWKYHPEESKKQKDAYFANVRSRNEVFSELRDRGFLDNVSLDSTSHSKELIKVLDALVVRLEGGSWEEVAHLDEESQDEGNEKPSNDIKSPTKSDAEKADAENEDGSKDTNQNGHKLAPEGDGEVVSDSDGEEKEAGETKDDDKEDADKKDKEPRQRTHLHKTASIFLRNIAPSITVSELEVLCKRFPGFLRIGLSQPMVERNYYRRGWISFRRDVNIKEICWNFQNIRVRECDLGAIVNRDLTSRIRNANGVTAHKTVAQADIRLATRLCQLYDARAKLWQKETVAESGADGQKNRMLFDLPPGAEMEFGISSNNPVLANIEDFLIEEACAEEDELLGLNDEPEEQRKVVFERDERLLKALDRIILYLRLVHSVDFYNHGEYPHEDEMPNRAGLIHCRGPTPSTKEFGADDATGKPLIAASFVQEFSSGFAEKMKSLMELDPVAPDEEVVKLGKKDPEKEVEAFITANTVELAKDKWLCPLSGKKFKGPEFIRKHLLGKHLDKLEEVKMEVAFFNAYLSDPKRPNPPPPEETAQAVRQESVTSGSGGGRSMDRGGNDNQRSYDRGSGGGGGGTYQQQGYQRNTTSWSDRGGGGGYNQSGGGYNRGGYNNYNNQGGNRGGGGFQREGYQRRDAGGGGRGPYGGGNRGGGNWQQQPHDGAPAVGGGFRRRDPREPTSYKDLDVPEDIY